MCPCQFVTQCVPNWKSLEKPSHVAQIACVKTRAELQRQRFGQPDHELRPIRCTLRSTLLELHDMPADFPTGLYLHRIHGAQGLMASLLNQLAQGAEQGAKCRVQRWLKT